MALINIKDTDFSSNNKNDVVLSVRNVGKRYYLYDRPQDRLKDHLLWRLGKSYGREFWALHDVSFDVKKGETVGIIGRNGSGKSTLLQMIAGVLKPTTGEIRINGRVAALLELGSGFNPEFTGRENVYLNGAILGIPREEMEKRFDEIASFADIGEFIDQPVKLYSSGMFVRLAFAVTTSIDADVLLIDEALAVGDIFFRQKCYRRLEDLRRKGVAIVLVSHSMIDIEQFCQRGLLLNRGDVIFKGKASEAVKRYYLIEQQNRMIVPIVQTKVITSTQEMEVSGNDNYFWPPQEAFGDISSVPQVSNGWALCTGVALCNSQGQPCSVFQQGERASFFYEFELFEDIEVPIGGLVIQNDRGVIVHGKSTMEYGSDVPTCAVKGSKLRFRQDISLEIATGEYTFEVGLAMISSKDYEYRSLYTHPDLHTRVVRLCHLPNVSRFTVMFRRNGRPVQLLHHGVANLPGECKLIVQPATFN